MFVQNIPSLNPSPQGREGLVPTWMDYALLEMSIIPIPHESKRPDYRWGRLSYTATHVLLDTESGERTLRKFFDLGGDGLAVICGRPSENLFVIDCDSMVALDRVRRELVARDIDAPVVYSSRGGHVYLRCREGAVLTLPAGKLVDIEIRGDGALVVLPPTRHQSGITYRWACGHPPGHIPTVGIDDLDFLGVRLRVSKISSRRLHDDTRDYLACGHLLPEGTRNNRLFDAARDYAYVGKDRVAAFADLLPLAVRSGLSEREASATIVSAFSSPATGTIHRTPTQTDWLRAFLVNLQWGKGTGLTNRRVFAGLIERRAADAQRHSGGMFRATYRELMVLTGIKSHHTLRRALKRLIGLGYVEAVGHEENLASLWRFSDMVLGAGQFFLCTSDSLTQQFSSRRDYCGNRAHLPETAAKILDLLRRDGAIRTKRSITAAVGCHRTTTRRNLDKLVSAGLVVPHPSPPRKQGGYQEQGYRAVDVSPGYDERLAATSESYRARVEMETRHTQERALFALNPVIEFMWKREEQSV